MTKKNTPKASDFPTCPFCGVPFVNGRFIKPHKPGCPNDTAPRRLNHPTPPRNQEDQKGVFIESWPPEYPQPVTEYRFAAMLVGGTGKGVRERLAQAGLKDWRFDWAWPEYMVAVGIDGNPRDVPGGGRHIQDDDMIKHNTATLLGWRFLHFSPGLVRRDREGCVKLVYDIILQQVGR